MEHITSRKNPIIQNLRLLARESSARREQGVFLCDGIKLLKEALEAGQSVTSVFWKDQPMNGLRICRSRPFCPQICSIMYLR